MTEVMQGGVEYPATPHFQPPPELPPGEGVFLATWAEGACFLRIKIMLVYLAALFVLMLFVVGYSAVLIIRFDLYFFICYMIAVAL